MTHRVSPLSQPQKGCGANRGAGPMWGFDPGFPCAGAPAAGSPRRLGSTARPASRTRRRRRPPRRRAPAPAPAGQKGRRRSRRALSDSLRLQQTNPASRRGWGQSANIPPGLRGEPVLASPRLAAPAAAGRCKCHPWLTRSPPGQRLEVPGRAATVKTHTSNENNNLFK